MWGPRQFQSTLTTVGAEEAFTPQTSPQSLYCDARDTPFSQRLGSPDSPCSVYYDARDTPFDQRRPDSFEDEDLRVFENKLDQLAIGGASAHGASRTTSGPVCNLSNQFKTEYTSAYGKASVPSSQRKRTISVLNRPTKFPDWSGDSPGSGTTLLDMRRKIPVDGKSFRFSDSSSCSSDGSATPNIPRRRLIALAQNDFYQPSSSSESRCDGSSPLPPPSMGLRKVVPVATPSTYTIDGSRSPQARRRVIPAPDLTTSPASPAYTRAAAASPEWEGGVPVTREWPLSERESTGQRGRSESYHDWFIDTIGGAWATPVQYQDPLQGAAMTPFVSNANPEVIQAMMMRPADLSSVLPSPGNTERSIQALDEMMELAGQACGCLRFISKCHDPRQQPKAFQRAQLCAVSFQNIQRLFKDGIYELNPQVFTISRVAFDSLTVATRRPDRSVAALAALARKLRQAVAILIEEINEARHKQARPPRPLSEFNRTMWNVEFQGTPPALPPGYKARTA